MPAPTCDSTTLIDDAACFRQPAVSPIQQKALRIYAMVLELEAIGGEDYRDELTGQLLVDSSCPPTNMDDIRAAYVSIAFANAEAAGADVPATIDEKLDAVQCLSNATDAQLNQALLLVECALGVHKNYPQ